MRKSHANARLSHMSLLKSHLIYGNNLLVKQCAETECKTKKTMNDTVRNDDQTAENYAKRSFQYLCMEP